MTTMKFAERANRKKMTTVFNRMRVYSLKKKTFASHGAEKKSTIKNRRMYHCHVKCADAVLGMVGRTIRRH
jgi:hypothetical protein